MEYNYKNGDGKSQRKQETESLRRVSDNFKKIVIVKDDILPYYVNVEQFLLNEEILG